MPSPTLPSLAALQSFEAAARLGSFTRAAAERHLTHSAISRNIQAVEQWCGEGLFRRNGPKVELLPAGQLLCQRLGPSLQGLCAALKLADAPDARQSLTVFMLASVAHSWLMQRLPAFGDAHPHLSLTLETGYDMVSLPPLTPAVAIRFGHFARSGLRCHRLGFDHMVAVAAPAWVARFGDQAEHWPAHQLLRHSHETWPARLPRHSGRLAPASAHAFNDALLLVEAAAHGCGVAWVRASLARVPLEQGRLCALGQTEQVSDKAVWLVCRDDMAELPQVRDFCAWAMASAARDQPPLTAAAYP